MSGHPSSFNSHQNVHDITPTVWSTFAVIFPAITFILYLISKGIRSLVLLRK